jgi:hypothetical protein
MNLYRNKYIRFFAFYGLIIFMNYFMPQFIRIIFFTSLLFFFYRSRENSFWIALFFLIQYAPAFLFNTLDPVYNLDFYKIPGSDRNISFIELSILVVFLKALRDKASFKINRIFLLIFIYAIFLFFLSFAFGISSTKVLRAIRFLFPYTLFWSLPALLLTKETLLEVFNYFLVFSVFVFLLQVYLFIRGQHFCVLLGGQFSRNYEGLNEIVFNSEQDLIRPLYSTHILFLNIITSCYYLITRSKQKPKLLSVYLSLSLIGLIITGTRGYSIGAVVMILLFILFLYTESKTIVKYLTLVLIVLFMMLLMPTVNKQMSLAFERILTVTQFAEGDITAGGTSQRFDKYMPKVMNKFTENPIVGLGFSDQFFSNTNAHVAIPNILLNGGIIGLFVFIFLILYFYYRAFYFFLHGLPIYIIVVIGLTGFLIVHIFSFAVFSFLLGQSNYMCFVLFLIFSDILLRDQDHPKLNNSPIQDTTKKSLIS